VVERCDVGRLPSFYLSKNGKIFLFYNLSFYTFSEYYERLRVINYICKKSIMAKVVLITGASSGFGKAIGTFLHQKGFVVYGTSRSTKEFDTPFYMLTLDVRDSESIEAVIHQIIQKEGKINVVINNAGVGITGALEEIPMEEIRNNFETNFFGPIQIIKKVLPHMRQQKSGLIINITSIAGYIGLPYRSVYSASKAAFEILAESISLEVQSFGIKVTTIAPGDFATDIASRRFHAPVNNDSAYLKAYQSVLKVLDDHVDTGGDPTVIAEKVYEIILASHPKIHYKVGSFKEKASILLKRILPDRIYEKMIKKHYHLP
jgi:short-subunit dehydrogenase